MPIVISIKPEPTPEELVAITAAIAATVRSNVPIAAPPVIEPSRWARQGRLEAIRGLDLAEYAKEKP